MTVFKICGLRDTASALAAAQSGASFLGFVFVEGVRRQLAPDRGAEIIGEYRGRAAALRVRSPLIVGLFANQTAEFVNRVARSCGLDYAQLCGDEPPDFWDALDLPVIRQVKVREELGRAAAVGLAAEQVGEAIQAGHLAALDKHQAGALGGTGTSFDWGLAKDIAGERRLLLAGGLTADNVGDAIAIAAPWGVDVSSGVETGGVKDAAKIRAFAEAVERAG